MVSAIPGEDQIGQYTGRAAVRSSGKFNIQMPGGTVEGIAHRFCRVLARTDGYTYSPIRAGDAPALLPALKGCALPTSQRSEIQNSCLTNANEGYL